MVPFLKWAGGKRWFVAHHADLLQKNFNRYIEPFLGSGSVYFYLCPPKALLADVNSELILTYQAVREDPIQIIKLLKDHQKKHSTDYYYAIRDSEPSDLFSRAARMIYLNRTCFNGIYRVNKSGIFNVPIGTRTNVLLETDDFLAIANILSGAQLMTEDFEKIIDIAKKGDFVFVDPPYTIRDNQSGFIKYNKNLFSWSDQIRLADALVRAKKRGVKILGTNANHESVKELYENRGFEIKTVSRLSAISANSKGRKRFDEIVILG